MLQGRQLATTRLLYYFWLPAGKDEFGFQHQERAPLSGTASYRDHGYVEQTISRRLDEQAGKLKGIEPDLAGLTWSGDLEPANAALGLQKVQFEFRYERAARSLSFMPIGPVNGNGMLLSNGLYLWSFDLHHDPNVSMAELRSSSEDFLKNDFVKRYIDKLFVFGWTVSTGGGLERYRGVMTYYQLDILFNGIFDYNALPHPFFERSSTGSIEDFYSVANIIKSLSLASVTNTHRPLYETHNDFTLAGSYDPAQLVDTNINLFGVCQSKDEQLAAEKLLSRLTYAAMEQFLRVAISFGVIHYKAGLDYCRAELTDISLLARANQMTGDLTRPSLSQDKPRLADLESYHSVLSGKVPILQFLQDLVEGLREASQPLGCHSVEIGEEVDDGGWTEWQYSESTLREAAQQFERQIKAIVSDLWAINQSLNVNRMDQVLAELVETRKLAEIEAETPNEFIIRRSPEENKELDQRLGRIALLLAMMEVYGNFGVFLTQSFFKGSFFDSGSSVLYRVLGWAHWVIVIFALGVAYLLFMRRITTKAASEDDPGDGRVRSYIFDYSGIRERVNADGGVESGIRKIARELRTVDKPDRPVVCAAVTLSRDTPATMGTERTKYTIESGKSEAEISYMLRIEVDRRWTDGNDEQLRDIRLVVRVPEDVNTDEKFGDITDGSRKLIDQCMRTLVLVGLNDGSVREFMQTRFGWSVG